MKVFADGSVTEVHAAHGDAVLRIFLFEELSVAILEDSIHVVHTRTGIGLDLDTVVGGERRE